ncbi:hypothetical protein CTRI78_v009611 [Colletotrichum trifolii]|uniref:Uncharacterized protein n=1 Tax=Colletotrichum trifolii TaxID=5466 RepID=A0A4R8QW70_COLTR|nr:hypothetical protein CTRI78_v009611 [Colletotrichum trifolii]
MPRWIVMDSVSLTFSVGQASSSTTREAVSFLLFPSHCVPRFEARGSKLEVIRTQDEANKEQGPNRGQRVVHGVMYDGARRRHRWAVAASMSQENWRDCMSIVAIHGT